jgi:hypothetical protein
MNDYLENGMPSDIEIVDSHAGKFSKTEFPFKKCSPGKDAVETLHSGC